MPDKPTKKWLEDQVRSLREAILLNQGAMNLCNAMIEKGIYVEEGEKEEEKI